MRRIPLFILVLVIICSGVQAQTCAVTEYSDKDGLPGGVYTYTYQDRAGNLWVGTYANGVVRFDGRSWTTFPARDKSLLSNKVDMCWQDWQGRLWFDHGHYGMTILDTSGRFIPLPPSKARSLEIERNAVTSSGQVFYFNHKSRTISRLNADIREKELTKLPWPEKGRDTTDGSSNTIIPHDDDLDGAIFVPQKKDKTDPWLAFQWLDHRWQRLTRQPPVAVVHFQDGVEAPLVGDTKSLYYYRADRWEKIEPPILQPNEIKPTVVSIQSVHADHFHRRMYVIWRLKEPPLAKPRYLLAEYDAQMRLLNTCIFSTIHLPAQVMKDRLGTYWICSQTALLRVFPYLWTIPMDAPYMVQQAWGVAQAPDGQMWFSSYGQGLARFDGLNMHPQPAFLQPFTYYDEGSLVDRETGNMYFNFEGNDQIRGGILQFDGQRHWQRHLDSILSTYLAYDRSGKELLRGTFKQGLWVLPAGANMGNPKAWHKIDTSKTTGIDYFFTIQTALKDQHGRYWMGHDKTGLACFDPATQTPWNWTKQRDSSYYGVASMAEDRYGNLWLGTDRGLYFLPLPDYMPPGFDVRTVWRPVLDYTGTSRVTVCHRYDDSTLIVGNSRGFFLLDLNAFDRGDVRVQSFTPTTGHVLGGIIQNGIFVDRRHQVWLTCTGGAVRFDPHALPFDTLSLPLLIDSVRSGRHTFTDYSQQITLANDQRIAQVYVHAPPNSLLLSSSVAIKYQFDADTGWQQVPLNSGPLIFPDLPPGSHELRMCTDQGGFTSTTTVLPLYVEHWWENSIFLLWGGVGMLGGIVLWQLLRLQTTRRRLATEATQHAIDREMAAKDLQIAQQDLHLEQSRRQSEQLGKEKDRMQVQAIVSQLNPHFLNNVFQWLQIRISTDPAAVRVVGRLAENIEMVFKNSRAKKSYHSLRDEMKLVENYLVIQKSRFGAKLDYELPDPARLMQLERVQVPLMVLQIHVENAIEHGIRNNATGAGQVSVRLREAGPYVIIAIEDDGIGRDAAKSIGSKGTEYGTGMLDKLEDIYNKQNELPLQHAYEDNIFTTDDGRLYGTRVAIRIPKEYNFQL